MSILFFILSCFIVGVLSRFFYIGKVHMSWVYTILLGVGASIIGNAIIFVLGISGGVGLIGSVLIGIGIIYLYNKLYKKEETKKPVKVKTTRKAKK